ncbi:MAG: hypothetical protein B2I17_00885 [Thermoplasmatales archaeon B_DKE]|nr:MAG: hypothetical protein B2I17_00885 [Thermoplasmatales archaeon B_DKE]
MDPVVSDIYNYSADLRSSGLDSQRMDEIKKRIADSIFVAYAASGSEPISIERKALLPSKGKYNSTIFFTGDRASSETATFINGSMTRYLDYSDTYLSREALHPSDNIPPILAMAEPFESSGNDIIHAIDVAYEVVGALSDAVSIRDRGWDHVTYISISSSAGLGHLLEMNEERFENLMSLGLNNNISMRQTRAGELSMWKGCTAADATRNSVFAASLTLNGFTGPSPIFVGEMGFVKQVSGPLNLTLGKKRVMKTMIKNYPVEYHAMSAVEAALRIRGKLNGGIRKISVETFDVANKIIIKDPEKLRPKTKETADHSMPYLIAYSLLYGDPTPDSYSSHYLEDPKILAAIDKMTFTVTDRFNKMYPEFLPVKIIVETDKQTLTEELDVPKGHHRKPYSWDDLLLKGNRVMSERSAAEIVNIAKRFDRSDVTELLEVMKNVHNER